MHFRVKMCVSMLAIALLFGFGGKSQRGGPGQAACRFFERPEQRCRTAGPDAPIQRRSRSNASFFRPGSKALKSANLDYQKVDKAISKLSDEDLAKLAERSRQAQSDFAAGRISDRDLLWIILIALAIVVLALALR